MQRIHDLTVGNEAIENSTEEPTVTEFDTDGTDTRMVADGGTEEIRNLNEVKSSNDAVRDFSADGHLYAYRDGDEHVVVSRGHEPQTRWTKRVPAERDAVLAGERLWTIPENWRHRVEITESGRHRYTVYRIPETGVDVLVNVSTQSLRSSWYGIKRVGTLTATHIGGVAWSELETTVEAARNMDEVSDDVVEALEDLKRRAGMFRRMFPERVNKVVEEVLAESTQRSLTAHGWPADSHRRWIADSWGDRFYVDYFIQDFLCLDREIRDAVVRELYRDNIISPDPLVDVDVEENKGIPGGYDIRALSEVGALDGEIIDYLVTEYYDLMTQADWAEIQGKESSIISKNVSDIERKLSD